MGNVFITVLEVVLITFVTIILGAIVYMFVNKTPPDLDKFYNKRGLKKKKYQ